MNKITRNQQFLLGSFLLLCSQGAMAVVTYSSNSTLTLTIDSISNDTTPGNLQDLLISGDYHFSAFDSGDYRTGDAQSASTYTGSEIDSTVLPVVPGSNLQQFFSASGSATDGFVDSFYQAFGSLAFENISATDSYTIQTTLSYDLQAAISGEYASNSVSLSTFDDLGSLAFDNFLEASADTYFQNNDHLVDSITYSFTLNPLQSNALYSDVAIAASIEAVPAAVPLPAAGWLMLSGLFVLARQRSNKPFDLPASAAS